MKEEFNNTTEKFDYLTQLYERSVIEELARNRIQQKKPFSLILIDVDNFKNVNDGYGHAVGDKIIVAVANKLKEATGDNGLVGRFGGDEFMIVVPNITEYEEIWQFCRDLYKTFDGLSVPEYPGIVITITIGLSRFTIDGDNYETLFEKADKALYRGKTKGRGCFIIYLDEKHKDIKLLSRKDMAVNSMQLHNQIFKILTRRNNLSQAVPALLKFLSTYMMIDHLAIQGKSKLLFSVIYPISKIKEFKWIDNSLISPNISESMGTFYVNEIFNWKLAGQEKMRDAADEQKIAAFCYTEISYGKTVYGYLRADTGEPRIWQNGTMDLLITAAKAIGMMLHEAKLEIDDLA
ncbi:MAG: GGDEF domain-containing protein [Treponema sp.]|nr:GGDEF domain-containing protein [Treponema sp.]MBR0487201.1 GGDEF domain-containing protein [Treponema sp.]